MFKLVFSITNPLAYDPWRSIWQRTWHISKHRTMEISIDRYANDIVSLKFDLSWRGHDHAGPLFEIRLFGLGLMVSLPDNRHWDYNNNCWETP